MRMFGLLGLFTLAATAATDLRLRDAVLNRDQKAVLALIKSGGDVNATRIIKCLVEKGADLTVKDIFGRTPLEEAEFEAPKPAIELLRKLTAEYGEKSKRTTAPANP